MEQQEIVWRLKIPPPKIDWVNKIIEGYDNLALVSTENAQEGMIVFRTVADVFPQLQKIVKRFPFAWEEISREVCD